MPEIRVVAYMTGRKHDKTFWRAKNVFHLDCGGGGYKNLYICQNYNHALKIQTFINTIHNKVDFKK